MNSITVIEMREGLSAGVFRHISQTSLKVLTFHELVLSVKVKGSAAACMVSIYYGGSKETE